ncbi:MAG: hypothetical protein CVT77_01275 [Alphaproteobacteria bacterium HGW-Alphaproteobacteria-16]|nr:MAG: hypothetical protein CVT77_01275 [Alphaproteobacteria bacterium HGW-Alphaproteobacteria-16]
MVLLVDAIQAELGITDTDFSIAHSSAFAVTIGAASVPAGLLVDRGGRVLVLAIAVALWSVFTAATSLVNGFAALFACRIGVAMGQAALNPACYALIADRFPQARLGLAFGLFGMGPHIGVGLAHLAGAGILAILPEHGVVMPLFGLVRPWRLTLVMVAVPGFLASALLLRLERSTPNCAPPLSPARIRIVVAFFRHNLHSFGLLKLASGFAAMGVYAIAAWGATLLGRVHGLSAVEAGSVLGPIFLVSGATGACVGGAIGDWLHRHRPDGRIIAMIVATSLALPFGASAPLQTEPVMLLTLLGGAILFASMTIAINPAATIAIVPIGMRGVAGALGVLIVNLIGLGCGPLGVAMMTDSRSGHSGALHIALAVVVAGSLAASTLCAILCRGAYRRSLARAKADSAL